MGFLFDVKSEGAGYFAIYVLDDEMKVYRKRFALPVYIRGENALSMARKLKKMGLILKYQKEKKIDYLTGREIDVLRLDTFHYVKLSRVLEKFDGDVFNTGLPEETYFMILTGLFPSAKVEGLRVVDSPMDTTWELPDLRVMELVPVGLSNVAIGSRGVHLLVRVEGQEMELETTDGREFLKELRKIVTRYDPHVVLSDYGDKLIFPVLKRMERAYGIKVFDVEMAAKGVSYVSYGTVFYRAPSYYLRGRWHIDRKNSFMFKESGLEGIVEISRIARIPVERLARSAIGTAMSALEYDAAIRNSILIPSKKAQSEDFRTLENLLTSDKGGLIFTPPVGVFENVAEIDFSQMYPTIMVKFNISPETVKRNGEGRVVPETGYVVETRRRGIIPMALERVLKKRAMYKKLKHIPRYNMRQKAIKWILVTCFGYLGYRNARFGKIEAHESVTAIGRELLLRSKEIAESRGFRVLHALTDSLWVTKEGMSEEEVRALVEEISSKTGISMDVEGIYRWIAFPSSKGMPGIGVPNRFFGIFKDGRVKIRGLMLRRHDVPGFIKRAQMEFIEKIGDSVDPVEVKRIRDEIFNVYQRKLRSGEIEVKELSIAVRVRKSWKSYRTKTRTFYALKILSDSGIELKPGEMLRYVVTDGIATGMPYEEGMEYNVDINHYLELLERALEEVVNPFVSEATEKNVGPHAKRGGPQMNYLFPKIISLSV